MSKKAIVFSLLASVIIIIAASQFVYSASESQKPLKDRVSLQARLTPSYTFPDMDGIAHDRSGDVSVAQTLYYYPWAVGICYNEPIFIVRPHDDTSFTVMLENAGMVDINFTATTQIDSSSFPTGGNQTTIEITPSAGGVLGVGGQTSLEVDILTTGEEQNITIYAHVLIEHDLEGYPSIIIPICMTVPTIDWWPDVFTLETTCKRLLVNNMGQLSNYTSNASMDYIDDPDDCADIYLYDGSPLICREIDGEPQCFFTVYYNNYDSDHALRQTTNVMVDSIGSVSYTRAWTEFLTADSAIGLRAEYFAPKHPDSCEFIIHRLSFWNRTPATLTDVAVGEYLDWDIPNYDSIHSPIANESGFDATRELIYQYTCYMDECDTLVQAHRAGGVAQYMADRAFKNYITIENDVYIHSSGPFGNEAPLPDDTMYGLMTGVDGPIIATLDSCEDLSTLVTFDVYDLYPTDTLCASIILVTSRDDPDMNSLRNEVDKANNFLDNHFEITCGYPYFDIFPGDANNDGSINVGDAVYIIAYIFSGGPAPVPYAIFNGDPNGDCVCNVGDAVRIICYVFLGSCSPVGLEQWIDICGWPLR